MVLLHTVFREEYNGVDQKEPKSEDTSSSTNLIEAKAGTNWGAIILLLLTRFTNMIVFTNVET